jgi:1,2-diacylglycerol 3-alpha-glucosyltransferase
MGKTLAISFTNFGPYHLARLRALAHALDAVGGRLIAYEIAGTERLYPWAREQGKEPFEWVTLFPHRTLETIPRSACAKAIHESLRRDQPDVVAAVGYSRPESTALLRWSGRTGRPAILMSESQAIDHPRVWWKEAVKGTRVRRFASALVGGPPHRSYLVDLGMPPDRIVLGYNAVDNERYARQAELARQSPEGRQGLPRVPYFLAVSRFAPEKNLVRLVRAYARYRIAAPEEGAWDLVLCGDGPGASEIDDAVGASGFADSIHRPGFLQADELSRWYAFASAFVHPSLLEPWGLVVNEAAACGLPLLVSNRAGCGETLIPDRPQTTGWRFNPRDVDEMSHRLGEMANLAAADRQVMGRRASEVVAQWGPERFARGTLEAMELAMHAPRWRRRSSPEAPSPGLMSS